MKIASIVCAAPPYAGGMAGSADQISRLLAEHHEVVNFHPASLQPWLKYGHGAFMPQLLWRLRDFDYIYLHYPFFGTAEIVWLFKLFAGARPKLIVHYHMDVKGLSFIGHILSLPGRLLRHALLNQADTIVTASLDYIKESQIKNYYLAHPKKFREIPFGLDLEKFIPKNLHRPSDNKVIAYAQEIVHYINAKFIKKNRLELLFVGGLDQAHYFKGIPVLLLALADYSGDWRLTIVGDGNRRPTYEKLAADLGLTGRIEFVGKLSDSELIRTYQTADLFILPSINSNEAFGIVITEALACGVPVLASDLPGVRSIFSNFQEGLLFAARDAVDLRKKLDFIRDNENLRKEMALAARRLAERKYGLPLMREKLEKIFRDLSGE